jgi:hypothetical protein
MVCIQLSSWKSDTLVELVLNNSIRRRLDFALRKGLDSVVVIFRQISLVLLCPPSANAGR